MFVQPENVYYESVQAVITIVYFMYIFKEFMSRDKKKNVYIDNYIHNSVNLFL